MKTTHNPPVRKMLAILCVGLLGSASAMAAPIVTDWQYTVTGEWTSYAPGAVDNPDSNTLIWGTPASAGGGRSSLIITNPAPDQIIQTQITGDSPQPGTTGTGLTLTHNNFPILAGSGSLTNAVLSVTLDLLALLPGEAAIGGPGALPSIHYDIQFVETPNSGTCASPSPTPCNDIFVLLGGFLDQVLPYNGNNYFLNIFPVEGGALRTLTATECAAAGVLQPSCLGFSTVENESNTLSFGFTISTRRFGEVPEPGILALLGLGLAAGALTSRRRQHRSMPV